MTKFKNAQVIILPTQDKSSFGLLHESNNLHIYNGNDLLYNLAISQNLYVVNDDKIQVGDWFIDITKLNYGELYQSIGYSNNKGYENWIKSSVGIIKEPITQCKKVIATTDKSLQPKCDGKCAKYECICLLPQPSDPFITKYIDSYNQGKIITDVLVEYTYKKTIVYGNLTLTENGNGDGSYYSCINCDVENTISKEELLLNNIKIEEIKINDKFNTITIKEIKNTYSREEVENLIYSAMKDIQYTSLDVFRDWIAKNL